MPIPAVACPVRPSWDTIMAWLQDNNTKALTDFLASGGTLADVGMPSGESLLWLVSGQNNPCLDMAAALIRHGADVNEENQLRNRPLHCVASVDMLNLLIACGAETSARNAYGQTALHMAVQGYRNLSHRSDVYDAIVQRLVAVHGLDVNDAAPNVLETPLHGAIGAESHHERCVAKLLALGANPNRADAWGNTPLHKAARLLAPGNLPDHRVNVLNRLFHAGGDFDRANNDGETCWSLLLNNTGLWERYVHTEAVRLRQACPNVQANAVGKMATAPNVQRL